MLEFYLLFHYIIQGSLMKHMEKTTIDFKQFNQQGKGVTLEGTITDADGPTMTLWLSGFLDNDNTRSFLGEVSSLLETYNKVDNVILDLQSLQYVSSTGIGAFMRLLTQVKENNGSFSLRNVSDKIKSVITMLGFISFFTIMENGS